MSLNNTSWETPVLAALAEERAKASETLLRHVPHSARRLLDCGCGAGGRGSALKQAGVGHVCGIERNPDKVERARLVLDEVWCGDLESASFPCEPGSFDCILCPELLAQVRDHRAVMERLVEWLAPDGLLVLTAPNVQFCRSVAMLAEGRVEEEPEGVWAHSHIRFFTGYELQRLCWDVGLGTVRLGSLIGVPPETVPLDDEDRIHLGRVSIGPLNKDGYKAILTEYYVALATRLTD